jgi:hypothetical protein
VASKRLLRAGDPTSGRQRERDGQVEMGSTPATAAKLRTSPTEVKRALVIEARRISLGHLVAVGLRGPTGVVVVEDMSAAAEVGRAEDMLAAAEVGRAEDTSVAGEVVVVAVDAVADGDPTFALKRMSYRWYALATASSSIAFATNATITLPT